MSRRRAGGARRSAAWPTFGLTLLAAAVVYGVLLGAGGFAGTEAHRAVPAWAMLEGSSGWLVPELFGQDYVRKPPGMTWAIAASGAVFGQTELAARLVSAASATFVALVAAAYSRRWFGSQAGLAAGLAAVLMPWMWAFGRSAEIEALNQFGVALAALGTVDLLAWRGRRSGWSIAGVLIGSAVLLLAKGPAGLPVVGASVVAAAWMVRRGGLMRRRGPVLRPVWLAAVCGGAAMFGVWGLLAARSMDAGAVRQSPGAFLWSDPVREIVTMPLVAWLSVLPAGLAMLFPWGPDARAETRGSLGATRRLGVARCLVVAFGLAAVGSAAAGIGNPRYLLPAAVLAPPVVGYVAWRYRGMTAKRRGVARLMTLGHPAVLSGAMLAGFGVYLWAVEGPWRGSSGRAAGEALAAALGSLEGGADGLVVLADGAVEARPEALDAMRRAAPGLEVRWVPGLAGVASPGDLVVLRADTLSDELSRVEGVVRPIAEASFHRYRVVLGEVTGSRSGTR